MLLHHMPVMFNLEKHCNVWAIKMYSLLFLGGEYNAVMQFNGLLSKNENSLHIFMLTCQPPTAFKIYIYFSPI